MKRFFSLFLSLLLLIAFSTTAYAAWKCSSCGQSNTGNFCGNCGASQNPEWTCSLCRQKNTGKFCTNCGSEKPVVLPIFAQYANSTDNILRATLNGEELVFYLDEATIESSSNKKDTFIRAVFVAYHSNGSKRYLFRIDIPSNIKDNKTYTASKSDIFRFNFFNGIDAEGLWTDCFRLWRGKQYNDENHVKYGSFSLNLGDCSDLHFTGSLDCTLTSSRYASKGDYIYDDSRQISFRNIRFDFTIGMSHPIISQLADGATSITSSYSLPNTADTDNTGSANTSQYKTCLRCNGDGECPVCDGLGYHRSESNLQKERDCTYCKQGRCSDCNGTGRIKK